MPDRAGLGEISGWGWGKKGGESKSALRRQGSVCTRWQRLASEKAGENWRCSALVLQRALPGACLAAGYPMRE